MRTKFCRYEPNVSTKVFKICTVGPKNKAAATKKTARAILMFDNMRTPLSTPETAERRNSIVAAAMIPSCSCSVLGTWTRYSRPLPICAAPKPNVVATPKAVVIIQT